MSMTTFSPRISPQTKKSIENYWKGLLTAKMSIKNYWKGLLATKMTFPARRSPKASPRS